jgi:L-iditol 2-dehydrogenase
VIETFASSAVLKAMVAAIKPGGKMILKSRQYEPVAFKLIDVLKKEPVMHVVNYGSFDDALDLLSSGKLNVDGLVDDVYALESFEQVFERASSSESLKPFFDPGM